MPKNIVICSDGTGNSGIKGRGTNVFKLFEAVELSQGDQIAFYDDGVGTESFKPLRLLGGAFGWGLSRNVRKLYAALVRVYEPGDRIFLFGFSRGAFTVRTLAGFIVNCGILRRTPALASEGNLRRAVFLAYRYGYRAFYLSLLDRLVNRVGLPGWSERFLRWWWGFGGNRETHPGEVHFIGVWDTVDAVGFPWDWLSDLVNSAVYRFKFSARRGLSAKVGKACHALSIDDERHTFHPVLWKEGTDGRLEQVWFAGVHSNVGGGYPKQGMSLVALDWVIQKARAAGLRVVSHDEDLYYAHRNVHDKLYNSRAGLAAYYHYRPRDIAGLYDKLEEQPKESAGEPKVRPKVHVSALERIAQGTGGYAPGNLPRNLRIVETRPSGRDLPAAEKEIGDELGKELGEKSSLLARDQGLAWAREWCQTAFVLASVGVVLGVILRGMEEKPLWDRVWGFVVLVFTGQVWEILGLVWKSLLNHPAPFAVLLGAMAAAYAGAWWAKARMERNFSRFWFPLAPNLRRLLG